MTLSRINALKTAILSAILLVTFSIHVSAAEPEYLQLVGAADEAVAAGDWAKAQECYRAAMRSQPANPNNILLLTNLGMVQHYAGEDSTALATLTDAHAIAPKSTTVLSNRGKVLYELGRLDDAIADFSQVLELDSVNTTALFNRGCIYLRKGDTAAAETDLLKYSSLCPDDLNSTASLAVLYSNTERTTRALPYYDKLIKERPNADTYAARAMCYLILEKLPEASDDIASGLTLEPDNGELYYCRAYLNHLRYRDEDARADADRARSLGVDAHRIDALFQ